jgi:hypothetical protein
MTLEPQRPLRIRIGRALGYWLVPQGLREGQRRLRDALRIRGLVRQHRELLARNADLRGAHRGRRCFVIGNGPSLARQDLSPLAGEITFVVNAFFKHPVVERWTPTYYGLADPDLFDGSPSSREFFESVRARCPGSTFFVPAQSHRAVREDGVLPLDRVRYVLLSGHLHPDRVRPPDLTGAVPGVINVPLLAIMAAMYAGCSPIYLLGLDHDWLAHRGTLQHFYAGATLGAAHPAEATAELSRTPYASLMESQLVLWRAYEALRAMAAQSGIRILNASDGGFLDVFERASYTEVVAAPPAPRPREVGTDR